MPLGTRLATLSFCRKDHCMCTLWHPFTHLSLRCLGQLSFETPEHLNGLDASKRIAGVGAHLLDVELEGGGGHGLVRDPF